MSASEQAVIGAIFLDPSSYWQVADVVGVEDFGDQRCARLFAKLKELCDAAQPVDVFVVGESFGDNQMAAYAMEVTNNAASAANARAYAEVVRSDSERRKVVAAGRRMALEAPTFNEAQAILAQVAPRNAKAAKHVSGILNEVMDAMQTRLDQDGSITGTSTGLGNYDKRTSGMHDGTLIIVAGRPSMGKTTLGMQVAVNVSNQVDSRLVHPEGKSRKRRVFVAEMEMTGSGLTERAISYLSGVDYGLIRKPKSLQDCDWPRIVGATHLLNDSGLIIDETPAQTCEAIIARIRQLHMQEPLSLVVIDHLGLVRLPGKGRPDLETGQVTKAFKSLSKGLGIPVMCLVQLNRSLESRTDKRPMLSDLRESGAIEEDADIVAMLYRDDYYHADSPHKGYAELLFRKNRDGETGMEPLFAKLSQMHFADAEYLPNVPDPEPRRTSGRFGGFANRQAGGRPES
jgi:replicative DNA helicase